MNEKLIIGIHGLNNKPEQGLLKTYWRSAISEGLSRNCGIQESIFDFELVYWADLLYAEPVATTDDAEPYIPAEGGGPLRKPRNPVRVVAALGQEGFGKALEKFLGAPITKGVMEKILKKKAPDLHVYNSDQAKREKIRSRLANVLSDAHESGKQIMLIAHSMGTIIAYDVLADAGNTLPHLRISHFTTVGSPLGLAEVKKYVRIGAGPLHVPDCVARWSNFADPRDPVSALDTRLNTDYRRNRAGVKVLDRLVINGYLSPSGKANPHKIYGYLRTPEVSGAIAKFIVGSTSP